MFRECLKENEGMGWLSKNSRMSKGSAQQHIESWFAVLDFKMKNFKQIEEVKSVMAEILDIFEETGS